MTFLTQRTLAGKLEYLADLLDNSATSLDLEGVAVSLRTLMPEATQLVEDNADLEAKLISAMWLIPRETVIEHLLQAKERADKLLVLEQQEEVKQAPPELGVGATVILRSGGPEAVVVRMDNEGVRLHWHDEGGRMHSADGIPAEALVVRRGPKN